MKKVLCFCLWFAYLSGYTQDRSDTLHIHHYDINLSIIDLSGQYIDGFTDIQAVTRINHLSYANLDLTGLTVDSVFINHAKTTLYQHNNDILKIQLPDNVINDTLLIRVYYGGQPISDDYWGGFYFTNDFAYNLGVGFQSFPHNFGRVWFPCNDLFTDKSSFTFRIRTSKEKMAVCGGLLTDSLYLIDSTRLWTWELNDPIPTYLASVAVGDYQAYKDTLQGVSAIIPIEIYTNHEIYTDIPASFANLKACLRNYEEKFGAYVWQRVGYVGVPFQSGAMEHACNIAYPMYAIDGTNQSELLYAHELAHSWFGNLITCAKAEEMWINEGFARYCEALTLEYLYPEENPELNEAKVYMRNLLRTVLQKAHVEDGDYYALNNVPQDVTYGSTSYDKGALIVHALRYYMGDSLFFGGIRSLLNEYAFTAINSETLMSALSSYSNIDLTDFYNAWINQAGFLHFSIDSIVATSNSNTYTVYVRQRLHHAQDFGKSNKIDLTFFSATAQTHTTTMMFSGEYGSLTLSIPFKPLFGVVDYYEKLPDACIDYNLTVSSAGEYSCSDAKASLQVTTIENDAIVRIEHHLVAPDSLKASNSKIYRISDSHYWRIVYVAPAEFQASLFFSYNQYDLDKNVLQGCSKDEIILLYRSDASKDWKIIASTQRGTTAVGSLQTNAILAGEYCLALGNDEGVSLTQHSEGMDIKLFPNPASDYIDVCFSADSKVNMEVFDMEGKRLFEQKNCSSPTRLYMQNYPKGVYILQIKQKNKLIKRFKMVHN